MTYVAILLRHTQREIEMFILFWLVFTVLVFVAAQSRNRSAIGWTIASLFISPLLALLFILVMGHNREAAE